MSEYEQVDVAVGDAGEKKYSSFWPVTLVAASLLLILVWQVALSLQQQTMMAAQKEQRVQMVEQSLKLQTQLESLVNGLLDLSAANNAEAKGIVDKYKINRNKPVDAK